MLQQTNGIVLRSVKYGETSLICTVFTDVYGVQSYLVQGIRTTGKNKQSRAGLLQPATLLDMIVYHKPTANLQRIKEFHPAYVYLSLQEDIIKNSIALFSVELLLRLLPEQAPFSELFNLSYDYFCSIDKTDSAYIGNYPVYFVVQCSNMLGYNINGNYCADTPYLNLQEGGYTAHPPSERPFVTDDDAQMLDKLLNANNFDQAQQVEMNGSARFRMLDWLLAFMHNHTQHMGEIRSLPVLRSILH
ncbi:MAG: DNA repair protein RecO [Chitinophagaceae bacterium]|nr:DNA repair protein RecO [Chitinophagaceae bacterium]MCB9044723.1 DNA repair protein RecO [Chitinophagales bacterium]